MNLDEKIATKVELAKSEILDLFQSSDLTGADLHRKLNALLSVLPLLEDIKTEVNDIQRQVHMRPEEDEDDEEDDDTPIDEDRPHTGNPYDSDPDTLNLPDLVESLDKEVDKLEYLRRYLEQNGPTDLQEWRVPWLYIIEKAVDLTYKMKKYSNIIGDGIARNANRQMETDSLLEQSKIQLEESIRTVSELIDQFQEDLNQKIDDLQGQESDNHMSTYEKIIEILRMDGLLKDKADDIKEDTTEIKNNTSGVKPKLDTMQSNMDDCCENMDEKLDRNDDHISGVKDDTSAIRRDINNLKPSAQANQSLALMQKANAALSALEGIRGLL